jgi:hypothetical protein
VKFQFLLSFSSIIYFSRNRVYKGRVFRRRAHEELRIVEEAPG